MTDKTFYQSVFSTLLGHSIVVYDVNPVLGGCINTTARVITNLGTYFIKTNDAKERELFEREEQGLLLLGKKSKLRRPTIIGSGILHERAYLVLEWMDKGLPDVSFWNEFGTKLARQHLQTHKKFGLNFDNYIGRLPQNNYQHDDWYTFFIQRRLSPQLNLAKRRNLISAAMLTQFETLFKKLPELIPHEQPALLHGDLWHGNFLCSTDRQPVVFDPAVYYGHRETELAFSRLFGGFDQQFYESYEDTYSLSPGFDHRIDLHNLYPLLVHVNLFGTSYLSGIKSTLKKFS